MMITLVNFILGIVTVLLSVTVAILFARRARSFSVGKNKAFSWALSFQLMGEAVIGLGTLVFATAAHYGWLDDWSETTQSTIRFIMFSATAFTTLHLTATIIKIQDS